MGFLSWCNNGLIVIQKIYEAITLRNHAVSSEEEARAKKFENVFRLSDRHKLLWEELEQRPELSRILEANLDLKTQPPTTAEKSFLNRAFIHFQTGWNLGKTEKIVSTAAMLADIKGFFLLPLPNAVWKQTKNFRDRSFVRIVERALNEEKARK